MTGFSWLHPPCCHQVTKRGRASSELKQNQGQPQGTTDRTQHQHEQQGSSSNQPPPDGSAGQGLGLVTAGAAATPKLENKGSSNAAALMGNSSSTHKSGALRSQLAINTNCMVRRHYVNPTQQLLRAPWDPLTQRPSALHPRALKRHLRLLQAP